MPLSPAQQAQGRMVRNGASHMSSIPYVCLSARARALIPSFYEGEPSSTDLHPSATLFAASASQQGSGIEGARRYRVLWSCSGHQPRYEMPTDVPGGREKLTPP